MKAHLSRIARRGILAILCVGCLLALVPMAGAEMPAANVGRSDVAHKWVVRASGKLPYTEPAPEETEALDVARRALKDVKPSVIRNAEHGYPRAQLVVQLARSLRSASRSIVGHELLVWNGDRAVRVYVNQDGVIRLLESGTPWQLRVARRSGGGDPAGLAATEIALGAFEMATGLKPGMPNLAYSSVTAHVVGFANKSGTHVVVRVDADGGVSYPEW